MIKSRKINTREIRIIYTGNPDNNSWFRNIINNKYSETKHENG